MRAARCLVVLLALAPLASCGDDDDPNDATGTTESTEADPGTTSTAEGDLPPLDSLVEGNLEGLQAVYDEALAPLDLVVTRGGVVPYRGGTHLQLYVEPTTGIDENSPQVYLDRILPSFQAILPRLFDAYPEMDSFDLCQEVVPPADEVQPEYEEPVTLLLLTRAGFESVDDWSTATLADLVAATGEAYQGHLYAAPEVAALPDWQAATGEA